MSYASNLSSARGAGRGRHGDRAGGGRRRTRVRRPEEPGAGGTSHRGDADRAFGAQRSPQLFSRGVLPLAPREGAPRLRVAGPRAAGGAGHDQVSALIGSMKRDSIFCFSVSRLEVEVDLSAFQPPNAEHQSFRLLSERWECAEVLFAPGLLGKDFPSLQQCIADCLRQVDIDLRRPLAKNILLVGGTSSLHGLPERLHRELSTILSQQGCVPSSR